MSSQRHWGAQPVAVTSTAITRAQRSGGLDERLETCGRHGSAPSRPAVSSGGDPPPVPGRPGRERSRARHAPPGGGVPSACPVPPLAGDQRDRPLNGPSRLGLSPDDRSPWRVAAGGRRRVCARRCAGSQRADHHVVGRPRDFCDDRAAQDGQADAPSAKTVRALPRPSKRHCIHQATHSGSGGFSFS
jgi:hypothetical protein